MGCGVLIDINELIRQREKASPNGVATLDSNTKVPKSQINGVLNASDVGAIANETDPTVNSYTKTLTSANVLLTQLKTVDGTGSGLDADLIRGINPSTFLTSETDPTVSSFTKGLTTNDTVLSAVNASSGTISASRLPSYVDDVLNFANLATFPVTGETGKIYVDETTNKIYRWSGSVYVEISSSATSGEALKLTNARTISTTGDATYSVSFDGTTNVSAAIALATVNSNVGSFGSASSIPAVTVNGKGQVTAISTNSIGNELIALQALSDTPGFLKKTGDGTYTVDVSSYQPIDADLTAIAGLTHNARYFIVSNGTTWTTRPIDLSIDASGILGIANGGTATNGFTNGQVLFGNGTTNIGTSSQIFWDNTNKRLGIGVGTPAYPLDVFGAARISGRVLFTDGTPSTSTATGALVIGTGGFAVGGSVNVGGALVVGASGFAVSGAANVAGVFSATNTTASTSPTTGASKIAGGQGVQGSQYIGGDLSYGGDLLGGTTRTWTPAINGATTNPSVTYNVQLGEYFRLGKLVVASFYINYTAISGGSGTVRITLPIATKNPIVSQLAVSCISYSSDVGIQKSVPRTAGAGMAYCFLRKFDAAADYLISDLPASCIFIGSIVYLAS